MCVWLGSMCVSLGGQVSFVDKTADLVYPGLSSGTPIAIADMNNDGLDDLVRLGLADTVKIEYQKFNGGFTGLIIGNLGSSSHEWGICIADVDENGFNDFITGGSNNGLKLLKANATGTAYTQSTLPASPGSFFLQASNFADINNDGAIDYFGCNDVGLSAPYRGDNTGTFVWDTTLINPKSTIPSDNSGNYGSVWTDYDWDGDLDLYISKCRQGVFDTMDGRRLNLMFENDGSNNFTEVAEQIGLRPYAQSWSTDFGDLDNDGDLDAFVIMHDQFPSLDPPALYYNDGTNHYTPMNDSAGIALDLDSINLGIQVIMEDFDNDGLLDIFVTYRQATGQKLFWNLGNMQFQHYYDIFPSSMTLFIQSAAVGDLNSDGFIDILAGHGNNFNTPVGTNDDDLLINVGNANHFLSVRLVGDSSNINGIGARLKAVSALGNQLREVRSGESYGIMNSLNAHFGLGPDTIVDSLIVYWPSGTTDVFQNLRVDQFLTLHEGIGPCDCFTPSVQTVTAPSGNEPGSLGYVVNHACPCDTIRMDPALENQSLVIGKKVLIGKDLVIEGLGSGLSPISTTASTPAIRIQPGIQGTISGFTITDDAATPPTYLIENLGTLTLHNMIFETSAGVPLRFDVGAFVNSDGTLIIK